MSKMFFVLPLIILAANIASVNVVPAEDAYITFRYAENMAKGHGLVYNEGERVFGSTEILFALILAAGGYAGMNIPGLAVSIGYASVALSVFWLLFLSSKGRPEQYVAAACILAGSPVVIHAASGFGMPLAGLLLMMAVSLKSGPRYILLALAAMIRPEAAVLMLWFIYQDRTLDGQLWFVVLFGLYIGAVTWYYGSPLPNSLVAKLRISEQQQGISATMVYLTYVGVLAVAWWGLPRRAWGIIALALGYLAISQYQNIGFRYQFWTLPALLAIPFRTKGLLLSVAVAACVFVYVAFVYRGSDTVYDERVDVGRMLSSRSGTMLTSEAGWLPYYSGWKARDAFGLYDEEIAKHGLTQLYIKKLDPDLIVARVLFERVGGRRVVVRRDVAWIGMAEQCQRYAQDNGYVPCKFTRISDVIMYYCRDSTMAFEVMGVLNRYKRNLSKGAAI